MDGDDFLVQLPFLLFILIIGLIIVCTCCCRTERGAIYRTPVVVTSATHTAPGGYPNTIQTTTVYPTATSGYQPTVYPQQAPYPTTGINPPYPAAAATYPANTAPYPVTTAPYPATAAPYPPAANYSGNPPSYDSAVGTHPAAYEKQMPYNPGYTTQY